MRWFSRLANDGSASETTSRGPLTSRVVLDFTLSWSDGVLCSAGGESAAGRSVVIVSSR